MKKKNQSALGKNMLKMEFKSVIKVLLDLKKWIEIDFDSKEKKHWNLRFRSWLIDNQMSNISRLPMSVVVCLLLLNHMICEKKECTIFLFSLLIDKNFKNRLFGHQMIIIMSRLFNNSNRKSQKKPDDKISSKNWIFSY